jgi:serine/threonine-protein kinase
MKITKAILPAAAIVLAAGLSACGTTIAPAAAPKATVTVTSTPAPTPKATVTVTSTSTPTPTVTKTVVQAPARVVYVPAAAPAGPALTNCGGGVLAGADTSCPFALNVEESWSETGGTNPVIAYSPVTGSSYAMNCSGTVGGLQECTGGDNALVEFYS